ncbi:hypothetical protein SAMN05428945_0968 [Streptomyces sp. 2224.1]|uniref:hypothetical protein n=1 Tax=unclassified Streptomyces TaxID=2593676 RepID=UPI00089261D1|nr:MULTISPECIES: hypothetical protein [unclassified Streptomyces]PBC84423.1 hypothetical protein BX261_4411 [Streptomyces sp. 2321.6]SDR31035.1 hypothetical protein SAMN05216511_2790 [Streptomyces sp. KS_16]SEB72050.1 hypothetical protein SAMN05428945_0968 [Streptomyces sp. 2224.1]SED30852.1 hypothetical protein SAMN05428940_4438 [Streptomyces sp. 2133.1]SEE53079.1 hypothetical protein SAMN05428954_2892 [Streptomyces sp. 2112.3]
MNTPMPHAVEPTGGDWRPPPLRRALRGAKLLVGGYALLSGLTLLAIILLRHHPDLVTDAVWVRASIVVATSLLMVSFAVRTGRGHSRSYLRLRLASGIMLLAIAVIVALPGAFPVWLKAEQGVCGVLLLGVVVIVNGRRMRSAFAVR